MSQSRLSLIDPKTAQQMAAEFLENRRLKHLDFTMTAGTGEQQGAKEGEGEGGAGGAGGEGTPSGEGKSGESSTEGDPQKKISALEEEKDRHFKARQTAEEELARYKAAEEEQNRAKNDEVTNLKNDLQKANDTLATTQAALDSALLDNAFLTENSHNWQNPARVLKLVDRDTVRIEDGKVVGVKEALEALAKSDPYLLKTEDGGQQQGGGNGGGATGQQHNGNRNQDKGKPSREELARKYPALRR